MAWTLGYGKEADQLDFILGFPSWFFWSAGVVTLIFCIIPYLLVKFFFSDVSLMPHDDGHEHRGTSFGNQAESPHESEGDR